MAADFALVGPAISRHGAMTPSQMTAYQRFVERLQCAEQGTVVTHVVGRDDDCFWLPAQYRSDTVPTTVLARMFGILCQPPGEALEEHLRQWLRVERMDSRQWRRIPASPNPCEVWRVDDEDAIEVTADNGLVTIIITDPSNRDDRSAVSFAPNDAYDLAEHLMDLPEDDFCGFYWCARDNEFYMEIATVAGSYGIKLPLRARPVLVNALMVAARKVR